MPGPTSRSRTRETFNDDEEDSFYFSGWNSSDSDQQSLLVRVERLSRQRMLGTYGVLQVPQSFVRARYVITLRVSDGRGGVAEDTATLTVLPVRQSRCTRGSAAMDVGNWWDERPIRPPHRDFSKYNPEQRRAKGDDSCGQSGATTSSCGSCPNPTKDYKL